MSECKAEGCNNKTEWVDGELDDYCEDCIASLIFDYELFIKSDTEG